MSEIIQCPFCYSYVETEVGSGYCILCDEIVVKEEDEEYDSELEKLFR